MFDKIWKFDKEVQGVLKLTNNQAEAVTVFYWIKMKIALKKLK